MENAAYAMFDTAIGRCAVAWRGEAVIGFALPSTDEAATLGAVRRRWPNLAVAIPGAAVAGGIAAVQRLLAGERVDLRSIIVNLEAVPPFERRVYAALRDVGPGDTVTYGELAARCGAPGAARAVGAAMGRNPVPVIIPCHRVLAGGGRSGGFSAPGGVATKFRILEIEQAGQSPALLFDRLPLAVRNPR